MSSNLVTRRLDQLRSQWQKAVAVPDINVIRWFIKNDEWRMIDAFYELESSEHGELADIFFSMSSPFTNSRQYTGDLCKEWADRFDTDPELLTELAADGIFIPYQPARDVKVPITENSGLLFFKEIERMVKALPTLEANIVIYLAPASVNNKKEFVEWITNSMINGLPAKVKLMLVDEEDDKFYTPLSDNYPRQVKTILPDLQMGKVMRQMATSGNPNAPDVQFRKCIFEMADAVTNKDPGEVERLGKKAAGIATKAGWKHLIATAHMVTAGYLLLLKKYSRSEQLYTEGINVCKEAHAEGDAACGILLIQCYCLK